MLHRGFAATSKSTESKSFKTKDGNFIHEGDWITLNGTKGLVYEGQLPLIATDLNSNKSYQRFDEAGG